MSMSADEKSSLSESQAKRFARWMYDNGFGEVKLVMSYGRFGFANPHVSCVTKAGARRIVASLADFNHLKEFDAK